LSYFLFDNIFFLIPLCSCSFQLINAIFVGYSFIMFHQLAHFFLDHSIFLLNQLYFCAYVLIELI
jgi:hypothetical protein